MALELESSRVLLRGWKESDLAPWIALNLDPENLKYFPRTYSAEESRASFLRIRDLLNENSLGLWAAEEKSTGEFMGFVGLMHHNIPGISFMPCHEIGVEIRQAVLGEGICHGSCKGGSFVWAQ